MGNVRGYISVDELDQLEGLVEPKLLRVYESDALRLDANGDLLGEAYPLYWIVVSPKTPPYTPFLEAFFGPEVQHPETQEFFTTVNRLLSRYVLKEKLRQGTDAGTSDASSHDAGTFDASISDASPADAP